MERRELKSKGHLCFHNGEEYYRISGDVRRARLRSEFNAEGYRMGWECHCTYGAWPLSPVYEEMRRIQEGLKA